MRHPSFFVSTLFITIFSAMLFLTSCTQKEVKIAILHTNDMHGKLDNFSRLAYLKDSLAAYYDTIILVSAGDMFSGNPYVDYHSAKGYPIVDLMNKTGYALATLGNHEFDYGQEILAHRIMQAQFPILAANIIDSSQIFNPFPASCTLSFKGIPLVFAGLIETGNQGKPSTHPDRVKGLEFVDPFEAAPSLYSKKVENGALIALTHLGYETDSIIAMQHSSIDVLIGGHSHTLIDSIRLINQVLIAHAGYDLHHAGIVELSFRKNSLVSKNYKLVTLSNVKGQNPEIELEIESYRHNIYLDEVLATNLQPIRNRFDLGCLFTDAQRDIHQLDFAFQNYYGLRIDSLPTGNITRKDILEMDPFGNELIVLKMSSYEIEDLIRYSYSFMKRIDLFISGGSYRVLVNGDNSVNKVEIFDLNNQPIKDKKYCVGINSYILSSYVFEHADTGITTGTTTAENLMNYLLKTGKVDYNGCNRTSTFQSK